MGTNNRKIWTGGGPSNSYRSGYKVFNEYMTHGVFLLFMSEYLNEIDKEEIVKSKITSMEKRRKFINFGNFYTVLKDMYSKKKPTETIADLYPNILEWCNKENQNINNN